MCIRFEAVIGVAAGTFVAAILWKAGNHLARSNDPFKLRWYAQSNAALRLPAPAERRVVFMGDSITSLWDLESSFPGKPYINRGIPGQSTPQMVLRFHQDVIALGPETAVIQGGGNDIAGGFGLPTLEQTQNNLSSMAEMATANHIRVVLCSMPPSSHYPGKPRLMPAPKILALNEWIKKYAAEKGYVYVDYHSAMKDEHDGLPTTLSHDGVHPLPAGYAIMAPLVEAGIEKALAQ